MFQIIIINEVTVLNVKIVQIVRKVLFIYLTGIFLVSRISSIEWKRTRHSPETSYNKFNLFNSLWFGMGSLMLQGCDDYCPR